MKMYKVKEEHLDDWCIGSVNELIVSEDEIKRLAKEWDMTIKSLMEEVEPLERESLKVERFHIGEYFVEVEEKKDQVHGLMWDAWIGKESYGTKSYMIGILADQSKANEPHTYTHDEALELIFAQFDKDVAIFDEEVEMLEDACNEKLSRERESGYPKVGDKVIADDLLCEVVEVNEEDGVFYYDVTPVEGIARGFTRTFALKDLRPAPEE